MVTNAELASKVTELEIVIEDLDKTILALGGRLNDAEGLVKETIRALSVGFGEDEKFDDLLAGVMAALVRSRSQGAMATAKALADKYLPEGTEIQSYGEAFVTSSGLYSSGKADE